ncbi:IclR family transcriptional regulator [Mycobacterium avium]|uniref:IclR family transcriptional regulator n=1 Tax=Mycobacterium avium TaxID=1764 RepID=UPI0009BF01AB|nr:helix-turn-helix domain-containing protein [Mycobacterium avium]
MTEARNLAKSGLHPPAKDISLTLQRGLALLNAVADAQVEAPTISDLAAAIGTSRTTVYRLLGPLQDQGLVRRDGSRIHLGLGVMGLAGKVVPQLRLATTPILRRLAESSGLTAHLTVADGEEAQAVVVVEPSWPTYHVGYRVGSRHTLDQGAAGRAIRLPSADPAWVCSSGELQAGAHGVAAPIRGVPGLRASVGVVALEPLDAQKVGPLVVQAAADIAAAV